MPEYFINRGTEENTNDNRKLEDIIQEVGIDDKLVITLEGTDADRSSYIFDFLEKNGFEVLPKGGNGNNNYQLVAKRIRN